MKYSLLTAFALVAMAQTPDTNIYYKLAPDAVPQDGVPKGEIRGPLTLPSEAYPGTSIPIGSMCRPIRCECAGQSDDLQRWAGVHESRRRCTRAVCHGQPDLPARDSGDDRRVYQSRRRPDQPEPTLSNWGDRDTNRPTEYNTLDDKYARVIVDELLPVLYKNYNISKDPERHGIGGSSSGATAQL